MIDHMDDLKSVGYARQRIARLTDQLEQAESMAYSITSRLRPDASRGSGPPDKIAEAVAHIEDLRQRIGAMVCAHADLMVRVSTRLDALDAQHAAILHARYVDRRPWAQIAAEMDISLDTAYRTHRDALAAYVGGDDHA